jgi:hypothetical protein
VVVTRSLSGMLALLHPSTSPGFVARLINQPNQTRWLAQAPTRLSPRRLLSPSVRHHSKRLSKMLDEIDGSRSEQKNACWRISPAISPGWEIIEKQYMLRVLADETYAREGEA